MKVEQAPIQSPPMMTSSMSLKQRRRTPIAAEPFSGSAAVLAVSAALLGLSIHLRDGLYSPPALLGTVAALLMCVLAIFGRLSAIRTSQARVLLAGLVAVQLVSMFFRPSGATWRTVPVVNQWPFHAALGVALAATVAIAAGGRRLAWVGFVVLLAAHAGIGVWKFRTAAQPKMDVCVFHVDSANALADGQDPYDITFPNVYAPRTTMYGPDLVRDGRLQFGYPYTPLPLLFTAPAQLLLGDFRYAQLLAALGAAVLIALIRRDELGMLVAAMLLFTPRVFFVLEMGFTEPLSVMLLSAAVLCAVRAPKWSPIMLGLLVASKQYMPAALALVPLLHADSDWRAMLRTILIATAVALLVSLPLVLWNVPAFIKSAVLLQLHQPYRADSLSLLAWWGLGKSGWVGPFWLAFVSLAAALVACLWRAPRGAAGFAAAVALVYFAFFITNKQAFANYYYFVTGALCCAAATRPQSHEAAKRQSLHKEESNT